MVERERRRRRNQRRNQRKKSKRDDGDDEDEEDRDEEDNIMANNDNFASNFTNLALVTTSKDEFAKVWDLVGQRCCQTLSGFGGECWASRILEHLVIDTNTNNDTNNDDTECGIVAIAGVEKKSNFIPYSKAWRKIRSCAI